MKQVQIIIILVCAALPTGCKLFGGGGDQEAAKNVGDPTVPDWRRGSPPTPPPVPPNSPSRGKVALVDAKLGFVVVDFTYSRLPTANLRFNVYRQGLLIGEVTTTAQKDNDFLVADINKGDIHKGDDVRP